MRESDILYENATHWVMAVPTGYEVYKTGLTHSVRCARIGWPKSDKGIARAVVEADKRDKQQRGIEQ